MQETNFISKLLAPLVTHKAALGLMDDVAIVPKDETHDYIITVDTIVEGVHFLRDSAPEKIADKLIRTNLSDIAAKGAEPKFYFLTGNKNSRTDEAWLTKFTQQLKLNQDEYNVSLIGGDTVSGEGDLFFSITMLGEVKKGAAILRSGAKPGNDIYVTGQIGEAYLGLKYLQKKISVPANLRQKFIDKYYSPTPRLNVGKKLLGIATACADISDGLVRDMENICKASKVSGLIRLPLIPAPKITGVKLETLITAGDDYELVFTAPKSKAKKVEQIAKDLKIPITKIGEIISHDKKAKLAIIAENNHEIILKESGYVH